MESHEKKSYKQFISEDNIEELRYKVMDYLRDTGMSPNGFAKELQLSPQVVTRFLEEETISFASLIRIDDYILAYERK